MKITINYLNNNLRLLKYLSIDALTTDNFTAHVVKNNTYIFHYFMQFTLKHFCSILITYIVNSLVSCLKITEQLNLSCVT